MGNPARDKIVAPLHKMPKKKKCIICKQLTDMATDGDIYLCESIECNKKYVDKVFDNNIKIAIDMFS